MPKDYAREYHSEGRVQFVKWMACIVCGETPSDNHHTMRSGMGMKGPYKSIVPLCRKHHQEVHSIGARTFQERYDVSFEEEARATHEAWKQWGDEEGLDY